LGLFVSTTGSSVAIAELGVTLVHPTTDFDVEAQFSATDISSADSLTTAITGGSLIWKKTAGGATQTAANYDPDYYDAERLATGSGDILDQVLRLSDLINSLTQATSLNGTLTLTKASARTIFITGSATGYSVKLPDATTLPLNWPILIYNQSTQPVLVKDGSGATLFTLSQTSVGSASVQTNGSQAGTWVTWQIFATGIVSYNIVSSTNFTSSANAYTLITGMTVTPQSGTYAIWFNSANSATGSGQELDVAIYKGGSIVSDSQRGTLAPAGTHIFQLSTQTVSQFDGTQACEIRVQPNGNSMTIGNRSMLLIRMGP